MKHDMLAAVDLGSNSCHLQIGRVVDQQIYLLDSFRAPVRLGAGLTRDKRIDRATQLRALEVMGRFGERLRGFPPEAVRAVGTNALRVAKNREQFLAEVEAVLGFPVEVVFGREEARLIYLGVAHSQPPLQERRLVVDIGGGSTEFIIGTGLEPELVESVSIGCVSHTLKFFAEGRLEKSDFKAAELAAASQLQRIIKDYRRAGWKHAVASSGTAKALASVLRVNGWSKRGITPDGLKELRAQLIKAGDIEKLRDKMHIPGMRDDRVDVLPGGLSIMLALMLELEIDELEPTEGGLRHGVLYDLLGRVRHQDMREATVHEFTRRYHVDTAQAARVGRLAGRLYRAIASDAPESHGQLLRWAASLHEIGISIAHAGYHKHSAYILAQADMPGFSQMEQGRLARLVLAHRGKLVKITGLAEGSPDWALIFAMRLAVLFSQRRSEMDLSQIECRASANNFEIALLRVWLDDHPLTEAALVAEAEEWRALGMSFGIRALQGDKAPVVGGA
ncbi:MAG: Ppx/GppA family phosphatase [Betaproteobacteria bacterium]|nr:Ppx/GppA family phosphatase [Betaproteobacteria bacterium]